MEQTRHYHTLHGTGLTNRRMDQETMTPYHQIRETKVLLGFTWLQKENLDIDWKQGKIKWRSIEANEDYMRLSVNTPEQGSEE